jgi:hypothetical protein
MVWVAVDENGTENAFLYKPDRDKVNWIDTISNDGIELPKGSIKKLIGRELNWSDEPVKLE